MKKLFALAVLSFGLSCTAAKATETQCLKPTQEYPIDCKLNDEVLAHVRAEKERLTNTVCDGRENAAENIIKFFEYSALLELEQQALDFKKFKCTPV